MNADTKLPTQSEPAPQTQTVASTELLNGKSELLIAHAGETYRLRITRNNKLILTK